MFLQYMYQVLCNMCYNPNYDYMYYIHVHVVDLYVLRNVSNLNSKIFEDWIFFFKQSNNITDNPSSIGGKKT